MVWTIKPDSNPKNTFLVRFLDEEIIDPKTDKPIDPLGKDRRLWSALEEGKPFPEPELIPKTAYVSKSSKRFPPIISFMGHFLCQQEFIDFVEGFEPDIHEYYPVRLVVEKTGEEMPVNYHLMNIAQCLESVKLNHPGVKVTHIPASSRRPARYSWYETSYLEFPMVFCHDVVVGNGIWRDRGARGGGAIFASDKFVEALEAADIKGWVKLRHYEEVSIGQQASVINIRRAV